MSQTISVGSKQWGDGNPCFVIAEAGSNHNGKMEQAKLLIDAAAAGGADAVKFQLFRASRLYPKGAGQSDYLKESRPIYDIIREMEMPYEWLPELAAYCKERGILFMASAFDEESVDRLDPFVSVHKVASYEMTHGPLLQAVARKGKPVILSTGTADFSEVREAVENFRASGNKELALMQCTAAYPAPLESLNVRAIATMKEAFGLPVGLSDHSRDPLIGPLTAVAVGANLIEKHFTLSNALPGPDHAFALEPQELRIMVRKIREAERALGTGEKKAHASETELKSFARRSIFAIQEVAPGEELTPSNIAVLRCGKLPPGLQPNEYPRLLGRRAKRRIPVESAIQQSDFI